MTPVELTKLNKPDDFALKCCDFRDVRQDGTVIIIINPTRQTKLLGGAALKVSYFNYIAIGRWTMIQK